MLLCDKILTAIFILFSTWLYNYYLTLIFIIVLLQNYKVSNVDNQ